MVPLWLVFALVIAALVVGVMFHAKLTDVEAKALAYAQKVERDVEGKIAALKRK